MKIRVGTLRKLIKEELQHMWEVMGERGPDSLPLQRAHRDLMGRLQNKSEQFLEDIRRSATNDRHDDAMELSHALIEIMDTLHFASGAPMPKRHKESLGRQMKNFYDVNIEGAVDPSAELLVLRKVETAVAELKAAASAMDTQGAYGQALVSFGLLLVEALRLLQRSNARLSSRPPPPAKR